jgi:hypothetical protein
MARVSVLFITAAFFITVALITGMVEHVSPSQNLEIRTWHDLNAIRNDLAGNYTLMNDLDSTTSGYREMASPTANGGKGWQPIAAYQPWADTTFTGFVGTFDGQGHQIRDLYVNRPDELGAGFFGEVGREGVVKGIRVVNGNVTGDAFVGLFAVVDDGGRIQNTSVVNAIVTGDHFVGGLVGVNWGAVSNSCSTASVTGNDYVGGLVGENSYGTVSDSYSTDSVTGNYTVGGLVGLNYGHVSNSYSTGGVTGHANVGGLVAENEGEGTISNSFWDTETSGQAISAGGTGKTTAEMQDIATFSGAGWEICAVPPASTNPAYIWNIVDHETYPFLSCYPVPTSQIQEPIEIVSVVGPVPPYTPAGPAVEITLKNAGVEPVISLTATIEVSSAFGFPFDFTFDDVTPSHALQPNGSTSDTRCLIGGGFSSNGSYPLTINATLQNGAKFVYTKPVQIVQPRPNIWGLALLGGICALFPPYVAVLGIPIIIFLYLSKSNL